MKVSKTGCSKRFASGERDCDCHSRARSLAARSRHDVAPSLLGKVHRLHQHGFLFLRLALRGEDEGVNEQ